VSAHVFQKFIARRKISLYGERNAVIINNNMAKKIYNKNAREAHLLAEAYQNVLNEDGEREFDERGFAKNTEAGKEDGHEPDNRNKGDTPWYDEKEAEDEQKELSHQDLIEWATQTGDGSLREEAYEALLAAYNEMERSKAALQAGQKPGGYYANM
jgi:hypothetical protein